jgi:hypothetical protein
MNNSSMSKDGVVFTSDDKYLVGIFPSQALSPDPLLGQILTHIGAIGRRLYFALRLSTGAA